jgi:hypothetical protein
VRPCSVAINASNVSSLLAGIPSALAIVGEERGLGYSGYEWGRGECCRCLNLTLYLKHYLEHVLWRVHRKCPKENVTCMGYLDLHCFKAA